MLNQLRENNEAHLSILDDRWSKSCCHARGRRGSEGTGRARADRREDQLLAVPSQELPEPRLLRGYPPAHVVLNRCGDDWEHVGAGGGVSLRARRRSEVELRPACEIAAAA